VRGAALLPRSNRCPRDRAVANALGIRKFRDDRYIAVTAGERFDNFRGGVVTDEKRSRVLPGRQIVDGGVFGHDGDGIAGCGKQRLDEPGVDQLIGADHEQRALGDAAPRGECRSRGVIVDDEHAIGDLLRDADRSLARSQSCDANPRERVGGEHDRGELHGPTV
jgi:hypothetical protein